MIISAKNKKINYQTSDVVLFGSGIDSLAVFVEFLYLNLLRERSGNKHKHTILARIQNPRESASSIHRAHSEVFDNIMDNILGSSGHFSCLHIAHFSNFQLEKDYDLKHRVETVKTLHDNTDAFYVPFRNSRLVFALMLEYQHAFKCLPENIVLGVHKPTQYAGKEHNEYSDCSENYVKTLNKLVQLDSDCRTSVQAPYVQKRKSEVIQGFALLRDSFSRDFPEVYKRVRELFDFSLHTLSCYYPARDHLRERYVHCGVCPACVERRLSFERASVEDKTYYVDKEHYLTLREKL